jgi:epoxyqueuosine reductase QueG
LNVIFLLLPKQKFNMKKDSNKERFKKDIINKAKISGANIIGIAPANRWEELNQIDRQYHPRTIFPFTNSVIVMGIQIFQPMLETTPSIIYSELYNTTNRLLDDMAYKLSAYLISKDFKAAFFPRDGYGDISVLVEKPEAAFSHVIAARYAGLGTIGYNHTLLTKQYGARVRLVSVFTDAVLPYDDIIERDLCIQCESCRKHCPTQAFSSKGTFIADMDKVKCAVYHEQLKKDHSYPCGVCIMVCPVGADHKFYGSKKNI